MPADTLYALVGGFCFLLILYTFFLHRKVANFLRGKNAKSLEDTINNLMGKNEALIVENQKVKDRLTVLEAKTRKSVRAVETVRFNPFSDAGSNQSFATSFVNEDGDGVVLSSLYSRERVSIFAKPIKKYASEYELTGEEKSVLEKSAEDYKA